MRIDRYAAVVMGVAGSVPGGPGRGMILPEGGSDLGAVVTGVVRDSISGEGVAGVVVLLDGAQRDTSDSVGRYRIDGIAPGGHILRFVQPAFVAILDGISFDLDLVVDDVQYELDVRWPSISDLVTTRCAKTEGTRYGPVSLIGFLPGAVRSGRNLRVQVDWVQASGGLSPRGGGAVSVGGFSAVGVSVQQNGGFVVCHLPSAGKVRVLVADATGSRGPPVSITLPLQGIATMPAPLGTP